VYFNKTEVFWQFRSNLPVPVRPPRPGFVNVDVKAVGVNPVDMKIHKIPFAGKIGKVICRDFSGVISDAGDTNFKVGDEVYGICEDAGAMAEQTTLPAIHIAKKPPSMSFVEAAALPIAALTALQGLRDYGAIQPGHKVLVIGASGGTGGMIVQVAKALGASEITGVCSARSAEYVRSLGATDVHDYNSGTSVPVERVGHYDIVFDTVSSPEDHYYVPEATPLLKPNGEYVAINGTGGSWIRLFLGNMLRINLQASHYHLFLTKTSPADLDQLSEFFLEGKLKVKVHLEVPMTEEGVAQAMKEMASRRAVGKIVVHVA